MSCQKQVQNQGPEQCAETPVRWPVMQQGNGKEYAELERQHGSPFQQAAMQRTAV